LLTAAKMAPALFRPVTITREHPQAAEVIQAPRPAAAAVQAHHPAAIAAQAHHPAVAVIPVHRQVATAMAQVLRQTAAMRIMPMASIQEFRRTVPMAALRIRLR